MNSKFRSLWEATGKHSYSVKQQKYPCIGKEEWRYRSPKGNCNYRAQCIDNYVFLIEIDGKVELEDAAAINRLFRKIVDEVLFENEKFVILNKLPRMTAVTSDARNEFIAYYLEQGSRILLIYFGLNPIMRSLVISAQKIFNRELDIRAARTIEEAFDIIAQAKEKRGPQDEKYDYITVAGRDYPVCRQDDWVLETKGGHFRQEIQRIGTDIFHRKFFGKPGKSGTEEALQRAERIFTDNCYLIEDFSHYETTDLGIRNKYLNWLVHESARIKLTVFTGLSPAMKVAAKMGLSVYPKLRSVRITRDLEEAIQLIQNHRGDILQQPGETEIEFRIRELMGILGRMDWLRETDQPLPDLAPDHPFSDLYSIVKLVQEDIRHVFNKEHEQKRMLAESEEKLKRAQHMAHLGSWEDDLETGIFTASDELYAMCGLPVSEELSWKMLLGFVHPDDLIQVKGCFREAHTSNRETTIEHRITTASDTPKWILLHIRCLRNEKEDIYKIMGTALDITIQKNSEEELRKHRDSLEEIVQEKTKYLREEILRRQQKETELMASEEQFRVLAETVPVAVLILQDDRWVYANPSAVEMCGYSPAEMSRMETGTFFHAEYHTAFDRLKKKIQQPGTDVEQYELKIITRDGKEKWIFLSGSSTVYKGSAAGIVSLVDITRRKLTEDELRKHRENLEELVEERTRALKTEIAERKSAEQAAAAANKAKSEFLANMSHEIRTPMNGVIGMTTLLLNTDLSAQQHHYLNIVKTSADSLLGLINDILDFSKIEAGKHELQQIDFHLPGLVESITASLKHDIESKNLTLHVSIDKGMQSSLYGDAAKLRQILINLLGNAVKFTKQGSIKLQITQNSNRIISGSRTARETVFVHFELHDTGIGIPAEKLDSIFESFHQVDGSYTRPHGGTGLGLAIVRRLVDLMNGVIRVESEVGRGTTFYLDLPFQAGRDSTRSEKHLTLAQIAPDIKGTVLLAEDDPINSEVASAILKKWGIHYLSAKNGEEALDLLQKHRVDLVLMDVQMPVMDGLTATRKIRQLQGEKSQVPVIAMTAHVMKGDREKCFEAGMDGYIAKPLDVTELAGVMNSIQKSRQETDERQTVIDRNTALKRLGGDEEIYARVRDVFIREAEANYLQLESALEDKSFTAVRELAHKMKSQAANIGAETMSRKAAALETAAGNGNTFDLGSIAEELKSEMVRVLAHLS